MLTEKRGRGRPKGTGTGKARELTPAEILVVTAAVTSLRDRAFIWLCLGAALRVGEACKMNVGHVSTDGSVLVERTGTKGKRSRRCFVMPQAMAHIQAYLATRPGAAAGEPLFPSRSGGGNMTASWGSTMIKGLFAGAGVATATSHSMRRTHANTARRQKVDILVIQRQLGHTRLNTTAEYLDASETERADAIHGVQIEF